MKKILVADDEELLRTMIFLMLCKSYEILQAKNGKECLVLAVQEKPDLIILDVGMPEMDGFETCSQLRKQPATSHIPIMILSGSATPECRIKGLDLGADDYMAKPFHPDELMARVKARLRQKENNENADVELQIGNLRLDPRSCQVWVCDQQTRLTQTEFRFLQYFMKRPNKILKRPELLGDLWPDSTVDKRTVDTHIANLRKKIQGSTCQLETIQREGYILKSGSEDASVCTAMHCPREDAKQVTLENVGQKNIQKVNF